MSQNQGARGHEGEMTEPAQATSTGCRAGRGHEGEGQYFETGTKMGQPHRSANRKEKKKKKEGEGGHS